MSDPSGRIALDIQSTANLAEVRNARSEVSALGDAARQSADAWAQSGGSVMVYNTILRQNAADQRAAASAVRETTVAVEQETVAIEEQSTVMNYRARSAIVGIAFAMDAFSRSADAGEGATRRVLRSLSVLAFTLGPEVGIPIAGALALGDALVEMWARSEKAAKKAQEQFEKTLESASRASIVEFQRGPAGALYSGDQFARRGAHPEMSDLQFLTLSGGQVGLGREQQRLMQQIARDEEISADVRAKDRGKALSELPQLRMHLDSINAAYAVQVERVKEAGGVADMLMKKEQEHAAWQLRQWQEEERRRNARRTRPEEVPLGPGINLGELNRLFGITGPAAGSEGITGFGLPTGLLAQRGVQTATTAGGNAFRIRAAQLVPTQWEMDNLADLMEHEKVLEKFTKAIETKLGNTMADALVAGITAGFKGHGLAAAFKAMGDTLLAGLGGVFIDLGKTYIEYSGIMEALTPLLGDPFTAGFAGAAIGAALIALGAALQGVSQSHANAGGAAGAGNTFTPSNIPAGGAITLIVQTIDPLSRGVVSATIYEINRSGMLNTPVVAPYGRPS